MWCVPMSLAADRILGTDHAIPTAARPPAAGPSLLDELMTARDVAAVLQMKVSTIEDYARRGVLPSVKVGRHRRFIRSKLEEAVGALTDGQL
jgi:excisionase family DNA binding protein